MPPSRDSGAAPEPESQRLATDESWRGRFRTLWVASVASRFGDGLRKTTLPLLATQLTTAPLLIAAISAANYLPWLLFGLLGGALADRVDRRRTMWITDGIRAVVMAAFAVLLSRGNATIALLIMLGLVMTSLQTVFDGASMALLPSVVPSEELAVANGKFSNARTVAENFIGAGSATYLFAIARVVPFVCDAVSFVVASVLVARMRISGVNLAGGRPPKRRLLRDMADGLSYLWHDGAVRALCVADWLTSTAMGLRMGVLVLQVSNYGLVLAISAVGGVAGGALVGTLNRRWGARRVLTNSLLLPAVSLAVLAGHLNFVLAGALLGVCYGGIMVWNSNLQTLLAVRAPKQLLGRVNATNHTLSVVGMPTGSLLAGVLAGAFGLGSPDVLAAVVLVAAAVLVYRRGRLDTELPAKSSTARS